MTRRFDFEEFDRQEELNRQEEAEGRAKTHQIQYEPAEELGLCITIWVKKNGSKCSVSVDRDKVALKTSRNAEFSITVVDEALLKLTMMENRKENQREAHI